MAGARAKKEVAKWREGKEREVRKGQVTLTLEEDLWSLRESEQTSLVEGCEHIGAICVWSLGQAAGICCECCHSKATRGRMMGMAEQERAWAR